MKTIDATLLAAQKTASDPAIARASLADNGHLHLARFYDSGSAGNPIVACIHASAIVRLRWLSVTSLQYQRLTDPTTDTNWSSGWASLGSLSDVGNDIAVFSTGDHVVACWRNISDGDIYYSRSATGGGSWSTPAVAYSLAGQTSLCGVSDAGGAHPGLFLWNTDHLYWGAYDDSGDSWASLDTGPAVSAQAHIGAAWDGDNSQHILAITYNDAYSGAFSPLASLTRSAAGSWSTPRVWYFGATSNTNDQGGLSISQAKIGGYWWLAFWRFKWWTTSDGAPTCYTRSDDGLYWEEPLAVEAFVKAGVTSAYFQVLGELSGYAWAADDRYVYRSTPQSFWSNATLKTYELHMRSPLSVVPDPEGNHNLSASGSRLTCEIDASGGLAAPELFAALTLERGYNVAGTDYYESIGAFYVVAWELRQQDNLLYLEATDAPGLLYLWRADQVFRWEGETLQTLVTLLCALAGVHSASFDANAIWSDTVPSFSINPGASGYTALVSLAQRAAFNLVAKEDGSLYFYLPTASPSAGYTYSSSGPPGGAGAGHLHWPGRFGQRAWLNSFLVLGDTVSHSAEAHDYDSQAVTGRRVANLVRDNRITAQAEAATLAALRLLHAQEGGSYRDVMAPPNLALELGDVIAINDGYQGEAGGPWRVLAFDEHYNPASSKEKFFQRVYLKGTT